MLEKSEQLEVCRTCTNSTCLGCPDNEFVSLIRKNLCDIYNLSPGGEQPYFGKAPCECCNYDLGGLRYKFTAFDGKDTVELTACVDCYGYLFT